MSDTVKAVQPDSLDEYFEVLTKAIFKAGLSLRTVEAKWDGFRRAFDSFDVEKVAGYGPDKIEELSTNDEIVKARGKIHATVQNAQTMLELQDEYGSFKQYLENTGEFEQAVADLKRRFAYVGDSSAHWFLFSVGEPVPEYRKR